VTGLVVFLAAVALYLTLRFELAMAAAALVALLHDLLLTVGVYALAGLVVTPATVIALLTVLGFSLYDTVIVFDRVRELDRDRAPGTSHAEAADAALNQTVARSLTTSVIALLPVTGLLLAGSVVLGAGVLQDLALAQFVGIAVGAYSSLFIATPVLVQLKQWQERRAGPHHADRSARPAHAGRPA
jgi:preprotein translocase subunit SecF